MQEIFVEIGDVKTLVSLKQLRKMARDGELAPETRIWVDGREVQYRQIAKRLIGDESAAPPVSPTSPVSPVSSTYPISPTPPVSPVSPTPIPSADAPTRRRKTLAPVWAVAAGALLTSGAALAFFVAGNAGKKSAKPPKNRVAQPTASPNALATPSTPDFAAGQSDDAPGFATKPFDASSARVPANYRGHDPFALYEALEKLDDECAKLKKDQFETRQEHRDRIQKFRNALPNRVLFERLKLSSTFAFRLPAQTEPLDDDWNAPSVETQYDADAKTFAVRLPHYREYDSEYGSTGHVELRAQTTRLSYDAVTRMNVPFSVTSITNRKYLLRYPQTDGSASQLTFAAVDVERAKNLTGFVAVLCVAQPSERLNETKIAVPGDADRVFYDLAARDSKSDSDDVASLDDPYERADRFNIIAAAQVSFWVYDVRNGKILAKIDSRDVAEDAVFRFGDGLNGAAAKPSKTDALRPSRTETTDASTVPFDSTVSKIAPNFAGHDLAAVCDALEKLDADCLALKRDQFETTEEYRDRFEAFEKDAPNRVLFGDVKLGSVLAFPIAAQEPSPGAKNRNRALTTEYDADARRLAVRFRKGFSRYSDFSDERKNGLIDDAIKLIGDDFGSDGLGIAVRGSIANPDADELEWTFADVSVQRAKDLTGNIAALCVCRPDYSFDEIQKNEYGPKTFASSTLFQTNGYSSSNAAQVVRVQVVSFWFYDVRNGEILAKIPLFHSYNSFETFRLGNVANADDDATDDGATPEPLPPSASFATTPFDPTTAQIAPDYVGHDPVAVWNAVQKIADERAALRQNDGETREAFEARIDRFEKDAADAPLFGNLRASSTFAFAVATNSAPIGDWATEPLSAEFVDASQALVVRFSGAIHFPRATESTDYFNFRWNDGASQNRGYGVAFRYVGPRENKNSRQFACSFVGLPEERAKSLAQNVGVLCVCSPKIKFSGGELKSLFSVESDLNDDSTAKRSRSGRAFATSSTTKKKKRGVINALRVDDATFWFYDVRTGEIFAKVPLDDAFRGKPIQADRSL